VRYKKLFAYSHADATAALSSRFIKIPNDKFLPFCGQLHRVVLEKEAIINRCASVSRTSHWFDAVCLDLMDSALTVLVGWVAGGRMMCNITFTVIL